MALGFLRLLSAKCIHAFCALGGSPPPPPTGVSLRSTSFWQSTHERPRLVGETWSPGLLVDIGRRGRNTACMLLLTKSEVNDRMRVVLQDPTSIRSLFRLCTGQSCHSHCLPSPPYRLLPRSLCPQACPGTVNQAQPDPAQPNQPTDSMAGCQVTQQQVAELMMRVRRDFGGLRLRVSERGIQTEPEEFTHPISRLSSCFGHPWPVGLANFNYMCKFLQRSSSLLFFSWLCFFVFIKAQKVKQSVSQILGSCCSSQKLYQEFGAEQMTTRNQLEVGQGPRDFHRAASCRLPF